MADNFNVKNKKISASSFLGGDRVEKYHYELINEGRIPGTKLNASRAERVQAFNLYRKNKIEFKNFVEKVLKKQTSTAPIRTGGVKKLSAGAGALVKAISPNQSIKGSSDIVKVLNSILATLKNQYKFDKKESDDDAKEEERDKRSKREGALEAVKKISSKVIDKVVAPFKSIIDRIWNFIFYTLLGRTFTKLMDWLGDPKNAQKVSVLGRFLKDWWPALLGLFFSPFRSFMVNTLGRIAWFTAKFALFNPAGLAITASAAAGVAGAYSESEMRKVDETLLQRKIQESKDKGKSLTKEEIEKIRLENLQKRIDAVSGKNIPGSALAGGGLINSNTGMKISGAGPDTQLTALMPGEIVMNRAAVRGIGADKLLALNAQYGGSNANKPKYSNNIQFAANGGMVGYDKNQIQSYVRMYNMAKKSGATFPQLTAAMAMHETGWMKNVAGNNPFNQRDTDGKFKSYKNLQDSVNHWVRLWDRKRPGMKNIAEYKDPNSAFAGIVNSYAPPSENDPNAYKKSVARIMRDMRPYQSQKTNSRRPKQKNQSTFQNILGVIGIGKQGGGLVKETTGMKISGATADRRMTALQPGEYVLPTDTVGRLGVSLIDKIVAMTDSNSNPTKLGKRSGRYMPGPLSRGGRGGIMNLPPITQSAGGSMGASSSGTSVPSFSAVAPSGGSDRSMNANIYGIV